MKDDQNYIINIISTQLIINIEYMISNRRIEKKNLLAAPRLRLLNDPDYSFKSKYCVDI